MRNHIERQDQHFKNKSSDLGRHYRSSGIDARQRSSPNSELNQSERRSSHASRATYQPKMTDLNLARGHSPHFSPSRSNAQCDLQTLHVHLPNHGFRTIGYNDASNVRNIINLIVSSMPPGQKTNSQCYALRLRHMLTKEV